MEPEMHERPPGPGAGKGRGDLDGYDRDRIGYLRSCLRTYGDVFSFDRHTIVVNDPETVHEVLQRTNDDYLAETSIYAGRVDHERLAADAESWMWARRRGWR